MYKGALQGSFECIAWNEHDWHFLISASLLNRQDTRRQPIDQRSGGLSHAVAHVPCATRMYWFRNNWLPRSGWPLFSCLFWGHGVANSQKVQLFYEDERRSKTERAREGEKKKINLSTDSSPVKFNCVVPTVHTSVTAINNWRLKRHMASYIKQITHKVHRYPQDICSECFSHPAVSPPPLLNWTKNTIIRYFTTPEPCLKY